MNAVTTAARVRLLTPDTDRTWQMAGVVASVDASTWCARFRTGHVVDVTDSRTTFLGYRSTSSGSPVRVHTRGC